MPLANPVSTPPLLEGDSLTSDEFMRRWEEIPDLKHAELIDGIVYMPSPVGRGHQIFEPFLSGWLDRSQLTPGCCPGAEGTWLMGERQVPQPDICSSYSPSTAASPESRDCTRPALRN